MLEGYWIGDDLILRLPLRSFEYMLAPAGIERDDKTSRPHLVLDPTYRISVTT